jgi:amino acid adenylation domain-containing protein
VKTKNGESCPRLSKYEEAVRRDANHNAGQAFEAVDISASAMSADKFLEKMLGGANEPATPFGLIRDKPRAVTRATLELDRDLVRRLREQATRLNVSLESLVYLTWSLVLARFCGQERATFGAALPPFTKVVPVRIDVAASPVETAVSETHELLAQIRAFLTTCGALLPDDPGAEYTLPALFGYGLPEDHVWAAELSARTWPLSGIVTEAGETLRLAMWAQNPGDPTTVCAYMRNALERLAGTLETVPDTLAASIDVMPEEERHKLLLEWNATGAAYSRDKFVHELFEQQAARTPEAVAVVHAGRALTYSQLNERANQLAHHLTGLGVGPDALVAICVERSLEMVVGLLAILKAGGAYVPMDPDYPRERLAYILHDSAPALLLTQASLQGQWSPGQLPLLHVDNALALAAQPTHNPQVDGLTARHLAYVIYTSGSTGQPKGVMVEHRQVARLFATTDAMFQFGAEDVWTLFHSYAFDFSVWELWGALAYGGRLVIVPSACVRSPKDFYALLCRERVTVLNQTPSAFRALIGAQDTQRHSQRYVIFGGEALELHTLVPWIACNDPAQTRLINMYGITETTVHVTYRELTREDIEAGRGSLVGRGLPDLRVYLLDDCGEPVPIGVPGEIYVGGAGVARGYLNRPQLTSERFLRDPFVDDPQARLYKSGDLGRWLPNGDIEYLGRNDFQVKIRGFRIELGEIEARLAECEGVGEVNVIAREDSPGDKRLVAYYLAGANIKPEALRAHLLASLPEYMVPAAYVRLDSFPLTHNGKLDRRALPAPDSRAYSLDAYEAPAGPVEEKLARIWAGVLGLDRISRTANFFDIGGNSLLAVRTLILIEAEFGHSLNLTSLFTAPSIATLGQLLQRGGSPSVSSPYVVSVQPEGTKAPLFAIAASTYYYNIARHLGNT